MFTDSTPSGGYQGASNKRNVLTAKISLLCTGIALVFLVIDSYFGQYGAAIFDAALAGVIFCCHILTRFNHYKQAKVTGLLLVNLALIFYENVIPGEYGIFLYYFPLIAVASAIFEPEEKFLRYFFVALPFAFAVIAFSTDFELFGEFRLIQPKNAGLFFTLNVISTGTIMIMSINFMLQINAASEQELRQLATQIAAKNYDLEKTNSELDRFLYSTSHDLRSPLSSIKGLINVARYDTKDAKMHSYFTMMTDRVDRLEYFIKDIIDYSKNARTDLNTEPVDFNTLVSEATDNLRYVEGAAGIEFRRDIEVEYAVPVDKSRINVILNNLLANAVKYHDQRKENRWIKVRVSNSDSTIKLAVSDNGTGIGEEHQQKIFDMFYRGTLQSTGSGLGLYIVKQAVEKMKGTISVQSQVGKGSAFLVTIPVS